VFLTLLGFYVATERVGKSPTVLLPAFNRNHHHPTSQRSSSFLPRARSFQALSAAL